MAIGENIKQLKMKVDDSNKGELKKKDTDYRGGRKAIVILFVITMVLSIIFWMQGQLSVWLKEFFGPSEWTFSR